jgi:hypothetical protein
MSSSSSLSSSSLRCSSWPTREKSMERRRRDSSFRLRFRLKRSRLRRSLLAASSPPLNSEAKNSRTRGCQDFIFGLELAESPRGTQVVKQFAVIGKYGCGLHGQSSWTIKCVEVYNDEHENLLILSLCLILELVKLDN